MRRDRPILRGVLAAGLSWMLLVGAITLGMVVPQQEVLSGFDLDGELDYSAYASAFTPLSLGFIVDTLGLEDPRTAAVDGSNDDLGTGVASGGRGTSSEVAAAPTGVGHPDVEPPVPPDVEPPVPTDIEHPFTNDDIEGAYPVSSLPFRGRTDTGDGTRSSDEPLDCFPSGGTAWYRYRPKTDVALFSDTFGTARATALGVYSHSDGGLELIGCDKNALGNAQVGFRAKAGTTYYFQVTSMVRGGPTIFELAEVGATTVESVSPSGAPADAPVFDRPDISADGRYVVFTSYARNLTEDPPDCVNHSNCASVYLRDRLTKQTTVISSTPSDDENLNLTFFPSISPDGRYVGFGTFVSPVNADLEDPSAPKTVIPEYSSYVYDRVTERYKLVSRNSRGEPARPNHATIRGNLFKGSLGSSMSADGRYVVFNSDAENLPGHSGLLNVYRRDLVTGKTRLVSTTPDGHPNYSFNCAITGRNVSGDGRYAVYYSTYGAGSGGKHVYLWDARTGTSRLVSKRAFPANPPRASYCPSISLDGSRVALVSLDALVAEDTNDSPDVYVYEVATERIERISVTPEGKETYDPNYEGREYGSLSRSVNLSADGRFVVFDSAAPDLAPSAVGSTRHPPETTRVFLHDIFTGATKLVSVSSTGEPLGGNSRMPYISADGNAVVFLNTSPSGLERVMVHELSLYR